MRQLILCVVVTFQLCSLDSAKTDPGRVFFQQNGIEGVIFSYPYPLNLKRADSLSWTPTVFQVLKADSLILSENFFQFGGHTEILFCREGCPVIANHWKNYIRQSYGYIDSVNDSIIFLNFIWKADSLTYGDWKSERLDIFGSCGTIWGAKVNFSKNKLIYTYSPEVICYPLE